MSDLVLVALAIVGGAGAVLSAIGIGRVLGRRAGEKAGRTKQEADDAEAKARQHLKDKNDAAIMADFREAQDRAARLLRKR